MVRALIFVCTLGLGFASGCSSFPDGSPSFTMLADDTIIVTGEPDDLNLAIMQASFAIGDPHAHPATGVRRLPSYHERSELRTVERDGRSVHYEHRTTRFETPEGITIETRAEYTDGKTTLTIDTSPPSEATRTTYANAIARLLRDRGINQRR
ncbi:MAG: hypothetical protein ACF8MJ_10505 [Phycisphaerales bacterium JB050]